MKVGQLGQQPAERFSYTIDYSLALTEGDNLQSVVAVVVPTGLTVDNVGVYDPRVKFWVSGGVDGQVYKITFTTTTSDGRIFQDEVTAKIKEV